MLSRLLDLRGQDAAPGTEQSAAPIAVPSLVTMTPPVRDRLALFNNLPDPRQVSGVRSAAEGRWS